MDSGRDEDNWFVELEGSFLFGKKDGIEKFFVLLLFVFVVVGGNGKKVDISVFGAFGEDFFVEVEVVDIEVVVEFVKVVEVSLVGVRVAESEVDPFLFTFK